MLRTIMFAKPDAEKIRLCKKYILLTLFAAYPERLKNDHLTKRLGYTGAALYCETSYLFRAMKELRAEGMVDFYNREDFGRDACGYELTEPGYEASKKLDEAKNLVGHLRRDPPTHGCGPVSEILPDLIVAMRSRYPFLGQILEECGWVNSISSRAKGLRGRHAYTVKLFISDDKRRAAWMPNYTQRLDTIAMTLFGEEFRFVIETEKSEVSSGEQLEIPVPKPEVTPRPASSLLGRILNVLSDVVGEESLKELEGMRLDNDQFVITIARVSKESVQQR